MTDREHDPMSVMLTCRDPKKSVAFYRDTLGFQLEAAWPDHKNPTWANLMMGTQSIMIAGPMSREDAEKMCGGDEGAIKYAKTLSEELQKNRPGVGVVIYVKVPDVDAYREKLLKKGLRDLPQPRTQFYGIRDFPLQDPDGFRFLFYTTVALSSCQSCGMPLSDEKTGENTGEKTGDKAGVRTGGKPGPMYCRYCTDAEGKLRPYDQVLEGTTSGFFMAMQKMPREKAAAAAREHLKKMPAWQGRS